MAKIDPVTILESLVRIPSDGVTHPERQIQEHLRDLLHRKVFPRCEIVGELNEQRYNQLFFHELDEVKVLFCCHVDTVEALAAHVTDVRRKGDQLFGLGTKDMKGGLAALLAALLKLGAKKTRHVALLCYVDEEHDQAGMREFIASAPQIQPKLIVSPESRYNLSAAHRGFSRLRLSVTGRAAHTARPHLGLNAITIAQDIYSSVEQFFAAQQDELLGPSVPTLTFLRGGTKTAAGEIVNSDNQVPNFAEALISLRPSLVWEVAELEAYLRSIHSNQQFELELLENLPPNSVPKKELKALHELFQGFDPEIELGDPRFAGYNDASALRHVYHCPTVNFGPYGENNHTAQEWVSAKSLVKTEKVFEQLISAI